MPLYNTMVPVVALIDAPDEHAAVAALRQRVSAAGDSAGFAVYEDPSGEHSGAFESAEEDDSAATAAG